MIDMPDVSPQYVPVAVIAQASPAQKGSAKTDLAIGICHLIENPPIPPGSAVNGISPALSVWGYLKKQKGLTSEPLTADMYNAAKLSILQSPDHATLKDEGGGDYRYQPASDYYGRDRATILVEIGGLKVKVFYFFNVLRGVGGGDQDPYKDKGNCPKGEMWRISINPDDLNGGLISFQYRSNSRATK